MEATMKTAVTVLQELMVRLGQAPEYECMAQTGPKHQATFDYRCTCCEVTVTATARSKKDAKQEVARLMLLELSRRGHGVPPPFGLAGHVPSTPKSSRETDEAVACDPRSYVALLKELCDEYKLPAARFELVGDTGPPHLRHFTMRAGVGQLERSATATSKKTARQLAAQQLYCYLRENLATLTADFVEEDALVRAVVKARERQPEAEAEAPWRLDLAQVIAEYHLALGARAGRREARAAAECAARDASPEAALQGAAAALGLRVEAAALGPLCVLELAPASPALVFAGADGAEAARAALRYLRGALHFAAQLDRADDPDRADRATAHLSHMEVV